MTRKDAREESFIIIFEKEFNPDYTLDDIVSLAQEVELFTADDFAVVLSKKTLENLNDIDAVISENLKDGWKINRISKVSLAILRLAVCEIMYFSDIPNAVSINEAVELSKKYAPDGDSSFVNGLLSSVNKKAAGRENA